MKAEPLTPTQKRLYYLHQAGQDPNLRLALVLSGRLSVDRLRAALDSLQARHQVLQLKVGGERQRVDLRPLDWSYEARPQGRPDEAQLRSWMGQEAQRGFCLESGLTWRARLIALGPELHVLVLVFHHLVCDGPSLACVVRELGLLYSHQEVPPAGPGWLEFAGARGESEGQALEAWHQRLQQWPLQPRHPLQNAEVKHYHLTALEARPLTQAAKAVGVSRLAAVLAVTAVVEARYQNCQQILLCITQSLRGPGSPALGPLFEWLPVPVDLAGDPDWQQLLKRCHQSLTLSIGLGSVDSGQLLQRLGWPRLQGDDPLSQCLISFMPDSAWEPQHFQGLEVELWADSDAAQAGLSLLLRASGDGALALELAHQGQLSKAWKTSWSLLMQSLCKPGKVWDQPWLSAGMKRQLEQVSQGGAPVRPVASHESLGQVFREVASRYRERTALLDSLGKVSYGELLEEVHRLSRELLQRGLNPGQVVGIYQERSRATVAACLAVLACGGAVLALERSQPAARLQQMVRQAELRLLMVGEHPWPLNSPEIVQIPLGPPGLPGKGQPDYPTVRADQPAYCIFTSGSSGQPKAVLGAHRGLLNRMRWLDQVYAWASDDVFCQRTPLAFVDWLCELLGPLLAGVPVSIWEGTQRDLPGLIDWMQSTRVTGLTLVPSLLNAMLKGFPEASLWAQLRLCLVSGEAVDAGLPERFSRLCPGARLFNLYGSAEVSADASWCELRAGQAVQAGRPLPDVCIEIVDSRGQPSPLGCPGEIRISGAGYRPGESFLTGDLGRWQRGQLEILGRRDQQLCVRGVRVEAAEVQGRLLTWPDLLEVKVVASQDGLHWGAFYRTALKSATDPAQLRPSLLHQLPGYLVPDALIQLEDFPRLSSGKVDRAALQALLGQPTRPDSAPADPLARLWCEVLRLEKVAEQDDFFALGGHSLLALHFVQQCQTRLGLRLTLAALLENPSLESLRLHLTHPGPERCWVCLQPGLSQRPPLILFHAAGGSALVYRELLAYLDPQLPVYALEPRGLPENPQDLREVVTHYLQALKALPCPPPWSLAGLSMGGCLAFEAALQMQAQGMPVAQVLMIDTWAPGHLQGDPSWRGQLNALWWRLCSQLWVFSRRSPRQSLDFLKTRLSHLRRPSPRAKDPLVALVQAYQPEGRLSGEIPVRFWRAWSQPTHLQALPCLGWSDWCQGQVNVHSLPGAHGEMLLKEPVLQLLGPGFAAYLDFAASISARASRSVPTPW